MTSVKELSRPKTGKSRATHDGTRLPTHHVYSDAFQDNLTTLRLQHLMQRFGLDPSRSALIAALAFDGGVL